ncbi:MAG TPA: hypothetical protein VKY65_18740 [Alphaproteobacteria bacterium]|nr:hypothetical protein [Alphaproteobacteria bacterium]
MDTPAPHIKYRASGHALKELFPTKRVSARVSANLLANLLDWRRPAAAAKIGISHWQ